VAEGDGLVSRIPFAQGIVTKFTVQGLIDDFSFMYPIAPFIWIPMQDKHNERWRELCELATKEPDPDKLLALSLEITRLLKEQDRLKAARKPTVNPSCD
jgi:hypothetical protein